MCGICGVVARHGLTPEDYSEVRRANRGLSHRGPDGHGELIAGQRDDRNLPHLMLAMRRLSIIDIKNGWQPLYNEDRSIALVANGEIYNHVELRESLVRNHTFSTNSDCEVILHAYEEFGLEFIHRLRGMFAFALWDSRKRQVIIVRDRMGEKPLYIRTTKDRIYFASEMKSLLAFGSPRFDLDPESVNAYLRYGWVPEPRTMIEGIRKLPSASMMVIDIDTWNISEKSYWTMLDAKPIHHNPAEVIRAELEQVMSITMRADVPIGIALSGGLDSSIIAAMVAARNKERIQAFTVGYPGAVASDERQEAKQLASALGIPFKSIELSQQDLVANFETLVAMSDDPIADIASYGYYSLSRYAKENGCPVLVQGQGADELFWGYPWMAHAYRASMLKIKGSSALRVGAYSIFGDHPFSKDGSQKLARFILGSLAGWRTLASARSQKDQFLFFDLNESYERGRYIARNALEERYAGGLLDGHVRDEFSVLTKDMPLDIQMVAAICNSYLLENGIAQGDRLSMANSVELRLPFIDYRLVETVVGLMKCHPSPVSNPKQWLIEATGDLLPDNVLRRRKKGFNPPVRAWISALREKFADTLRDGYLVNAGVVRSSFMDLVQREHSRISPWNDAFFRLLVLESWCQQFSVMQSSHSGSESRVA